VEAGRGESARGWARVEMEAMASGGILTLQAGGLSPCNKNDLTGFFWTPPPVRPSCIKLLNGR